MPLRMRILFIIILIVCVFMVFILTSVDHNERAGRPDIDHNPLIYLNQHVENEVGKKVTRNMKAASRRLGIDHMIHLNGHIKNEVDKRVIATINTKKPTTSSSRFVTVLSKLNPGNRTLSTRQGKCTDTVCSNFLTNSEMKCAKAVAARIKPAARVTPRCHFQNGTMKRRVLLRSFPGSGNTWTRELLEKSSGICTGSIYCDSSIWKSGMIGEGVKSSSVLVVKSHDLGSHGDATVAIIRNPADAIVSFWKWQITVHNVYKGQAHVTNLPMTFFRNNTKWNTFISKEIYNWKNLVKGELLSFNHTKHPLLIVRYEDMKENVSKEVFRMLNFLSVDYSTGEVIKGLKEDISTFKRPKPVHEFDPYTLQQRKKIVSVLKEFLKWLHEHHEVTMSRIVYNYLLQNSRKTLAQSEP